MSDCFFISTLPEYVHNRKIIINHIHIHYVNGYKLAKASEYFKEKLIKLHQMESSKYQHKVEDKIVRSKYQQSCRSTVKNLFNVKLQPLVINYTDITALECLLSFVHCNEEVRSNMLIGYLQSSTINSVLKAGLYFQAPEFINHCLQTVQIKLNMNTCWHYWKVAEEFNTHLPEYQMITSRYVLANFIEAGKSKEFLNLNVDDLKKLLKEDSLNSSNEKYLFVIIEKWINHQQLERGKYIGDLLACLRLGRLTHKELDDLSKHSLVQAEWNSCSSILQMAGYSNEELSLNLNDSLILRPEDKAELFAYIFKPRLPYAAIFVIGGWEGNQNDFIISPSTVIQVYNSRTNTWHRIVSDVLALDEGHAYSGCIFYKTRIYIVGGFLSSGPTQILKAFELTNLTWRILSPMHEKRNYVCICGLNNAIYAIGGHNGKSRLNSVERYDIDKNHWTFISPMHQVRSDAGAHSLLGLIYVVGGFDGHQMHNTVEMYNPCTDQWSFIAPMHDIRSGVSVIVYDHYLYAIGGNNGLQRLKSVERYNPDTNQWQIMPSMIYHRSNCCVTILDDMIYVIGGWSDETNSTISSVERWSPNNFSQWEPVQDLHFPISASCCCSVTGLEFLSDFL
ncbi:Kelch-like protein [Schistosoma japonicum]|uniref:Kelch-like protein n=1 Tax=Schistosoma japonicum TaxID=6182 RepID=A0A4Z2CRF9_SCHJA|nr:Kelch-like protein [Schistosoma japonicum]